MSSNHHGTAVRTPRVDACLHPAPRNANDIRHYMVEPWKSRAFPGPEFYDYVGPEQPYLDVAAEVAGLPGSEPTQIRDWLQHECQVDMAVLLPLTRGLLPNLDLNAAIAAATNQWLAEEWLSTQGDVRLYGSIRVDPRDPDSAVAEIERWSKDPAMVQVAVPMQSEAPYGHRRYLKVWETAARRQLPVVVHADGGSGIGFNPSPAARPKYRVEMEVLYPANFAYHLASLLAEGVFEQYPELTFVFADGGHDMLAPVIWRLDKDWRPNRADVPWMKRSPLEYVARNVRFCTNAYDRAEDEDLDREWMEVCMASTTLMFASNYPFRDASTQAHLASILDPEVATNVLGGTAKGTYGL